VLGSSSATAVFGNASESVAGQRNEAAMYGASIGTTASGHRRGYWAGGADPVGVAGICAVAVTLPLLSNVVRLRTMF
jgi:hypothetical protein